MKVHKIEVLVLDFDDYGVDEYNVLLSYNRIDGMSVLSSETVEIGEWDDDNPLNFKDTRKSEADRLFSNK